MKTVSLEKQMTAGGFSAEIVNRQFCPIRNSSLRKTLDELLGFIRSQQNHSNMAGQVKNAIELSRRCVTSYPNSVAKLFCVVDKIVKRFGDKQLVLEVADLSIDAARRSINRTEDVMKGEAVALICGRSWVYQRIDRLSDAIAAGETSLELGELFGWERNSIFCKKCIGRIYRMQAEKELETHNPDRQKVADLLDKSTDCLTEAIQRFSQLEEFGPDDPEVGDCYSLLGRAFLVSKKLTEADDAVKKAFKLIPESSDKDYLDLLILAGDLQVRRGNSEGAENFYSSALKTNSEDAEITEMRARAYLRRGLTRAAMKRMQDAVRDMNKAVEIFRSLGEIEKSNHARWELMRIQKEIPREAFPLLEEERYTTRVIALDTYFAQQTNRRRRQNLVGQRVALSSEQWRELVKRSPPPSREGRSELVKGSIVWKSAAARRLLKLADDPTSVEQAIEILANRYLAGLSCPPTDLKAVSARLKIKEFREEEFLGSGELRRDRKGLVIVYSPYLSMERRRFTIAHEMAHALFEASGPRFPRYGRELERLCDMFAKEILMPRDAFLKAINSDVTLNKVVEVAAIFQTSLSATSIRFCELLPKKVSAFEVNNGVVSWSHGIPRRNSRNFQPMIEDALGGQRINTEIHLNYPQRQGRWKLEGVPLGNKGNRALFFLHKASDLYRDGCA